MARRELRGMCVVLFGMPAAGKSSLLGALAQASQTQPGLLGGQLKDESGGLKELRERVYSDKSQETLEEIVPYPVTFKPQDKGHVIQATLIDCDGRIAHSFLSGQRALGATQGQVDLARAIEQADVLLLVVDVSAESDQLKRDFQQFTRFLRHLEQHRSRGAEVAGLPVYLVLAKCDLLARDKDSTSHWLERIEEGKRKISQRFKEFLAAEEEREAKPFGQIDLHVWATAVKRPALTDKPARPTEPFGVAELFRQCLAAGEDFREKRGRSERRLKVAMTGIIAVLVIFLLTGAYFLITRPSSELTALQNQASAAIPTPENRLKEPLETKIKDLAKVIGHPEFPKLSDQLKYDVEYAYAELTKYRGLLERFRENDLTPEEFSKEANLLAFEKFLKEFTIPTDYVETWQTSELMKGLDERRAQVRSFREALANLETRLRALIKKGDELRDDRFNIGESLPKYVQWIKKVGEYLEVKLPPETDPIAGAPGVTLKRVYEYRQIQALVRQWEEMKASLRKDRDELEKKLKG